MSSPDQPPNQPIKPANSQLFSLFVWSEQTNHDGVTWRGQLKQVANQQVVYFSTWEELVVQLQAQVTHIEEK